MVLGFLEHQNISYTPISPKALYFDFLTPNDTFPRKGLSCFKIFYLKKKKDFLLVKDVWTANQNLWAEEDNTLIVIKHLL